ncbi:MAG: hypothetical protein ACKO0Z_07835 [Betaproteobacteria bacterium]
MNGSDAPIRLIAPVAQSGPRVPIPATQDGIAGTGRASLDQGWPAETMPTTPGAGTPPAGQAANGLLYLLSEPSVWAGAGYIYPWSSDYATSIGGYPAPAIVSNNDGTQIYVNTTQNNLSDPTAGGTGWYLVSTQPRGVSYAESAPIVITTADTFTDLVSLTASDLRSLPFVVDVVVHANNWAAGAESDAIGQVQVSVDGDVTDLQYIGSVTSGSAGDDSYWGISALYRYVGNKTGDVLKTSAAIDVKARLKVGSSKSLQVSKASITCYLVTT